MTLRTDHPGTRPAGASLMRSPAHATAAGRVPSSVLGVPRGMAAQLVRFGAVGVASTLAYLLLFAVLRPDAGARA